MKYVHGWAFPDADAFMATQLTAAGTYQDDHLRLAMTFVTDRSCSIDAGAHVGTWSRLMSADFLRVIAVEPSADTFEALTENMTTFGCANVEVKNLAVGDAPGFVTMVLDGRGAALKNTGARYVKPHGTIPVETIDSWGLATVGFIKLDIEGSEYAALRGAKDTLRRCRPIVLFEDKGFGRRLGYEKNATQTFLTAHGYQEVARMSMDHIWRAVPR